MNAVRARSTQANKTAHKYTMSVCRVVSLSEIMGLNVSPTGSVSPTKSSVFIIFYNTASAASLVFGVELNCCDI